MKIVPIGRLTGEDQYMVVVDGEQLHDLIACVDLANRLLDHAAIDGGFLTRSMAFRGCESMTRDRRSLHQQLQREYQEITKCGN